MNTPVNDRFADYLRQISGGLKHMNAEQRNDVLAEIRSHLAERNSFVAKVPLRPNRMRSVPLETQIRLRFNSRRKLWNRRQAVVSGPGF